MPLERNYQTRRFNGEIRHFYTFAEALKDARDLAVWKISFGLPTGERVRLIRDHSVENFVLDQMPDFDEWLNKRMNKTKGDSSPDVS